MQRVYGAHPRDQGHGHLVINDALAKWSASPKTGERRALEDNNLRQELLASTSLHFASASHFSRFGPGFQGFFGYPT